MRHIQTDILVIGGGATGTGILRDLAMRGYKCLLVEWRDLAYGTTGRFHGLLHSGGRYAVKDLLAARECIEENRILRRIMPQCIEDTGGYFVLTTQDDPDYVPLFLAGCDQAGIPVEEVSIRQMLKEEPNLNPSIQRCFRLPDASADSFLAAELNIESARQHGAHLLTYHEVKSLTSQAAPGNTPSRIVGAVCHDLVSDEDVQVDATLVVNASGPWAGKIARLAGIDLQMLPGKGTMVAVSHRIVNTVINRCKLPADGDILVPAHTVTVMGTTDIRVADPDHYTIEPWEIRLMLDEGEKIIPRFKELRIIRAWAGVRPLVQAGTQVSDRDISRSFTLLDHEQRDGIEGLITITGGKWTTYRKMAEATVDKVGEKLAFARACRTHLEELPSVSQAGKHAHHLGGLLEKIEHKAAYGQLVCECELVTRAEVERAIIASNAQTIDDIRRDVRLGMGPCQGAFCAIRAAGTLHALRHTPVSLTNVYLRDFLQERWKGNRPVLWGQQLRQIRFNELIYINVLNTPYLPGETSSRLSADSYTPLESRVDIRATEKSLLNDYGGKHIGQQPVDVVVIGAGLSGLMAAWRACHGGRKTELISKGWSANYWGSGCIDIMGYLPPDFSHKVISPADGLRSFIQSHPDHPYAIAGLEKLDQALQSFIQLSQESGNPYSGSLETNIWLPTALGSLRPTCLIPASMMAGDAKQSAPMLIVGFSSFLDFYPALVADNLSAQGMLAQSLTLELKSLQARKFLSATILARLFDNAEFRQEVIAAIKPRLGRAHRVGFPAVLGMEKSAEVLNDLQSSLGVPVFEIPGLPPSIPGMRLHQMLVSAINNLQGRVFPGMAVLQAVAEGDTVMSVWSEAAARKVSHAAQVFVAATGGYLGGGFTTYELGYAQEPIFNLPVDTPSPRSPWFHDQLLSADSHPIFTTGIKVNPDFQPADGAGKVIFRNLYATGSLLGSCDPIRERSLEGIALATGFVVGERLSARSSQ